MTSKKRMLLLLSTLCLLVSESALAYIPPYWMIMSRVSDNHGKGAYLVDQDVVFTHGDEALLINERWTVLDENSLRLEVTGRRSLQNRIRLTYVYHNNRRYYVDENGVRKADKIPDNFFEPYFHFRLSKNIKPVLVAQKIAPSISLKSEAHRYSPKKPLPDPEPYVRLSRVGGQVNYAIGSPTPSSSDERYPGIWIEQDQFVIRKLRLPSQLEIQANDYKSFDRGLWLPRERSLRWGNSSAKILLNSATAISTTTKVKAALESSSLNFGENPGLGRLLPEDETVRYFYTNLR